MGKYAGKPAAIFFTYASTKMPPGNPGSLSGAVYAQILAYILEQNGLPTGNTEFASNAATLASVMIPGTPGRGGGATVRAVA